MKKILLSLAFIMIFGCGDFYNTCFSAEEKVPVLEASIRFEWLNMLQFQREERVDKYREQLFGENSFGSYTRSEFKEAYQDWAKDLNHKTHYRLVSNGRTETKEYNMAGFYKKFKGEDILYAYALQPKDDMKHAYYYNALGHLAYVDVFSKNYPNFPYYSKQYRANGKLAGSIYFETRDLQYTFGPKGKFKGVWYKDKMYDINGKELLTRTNW